VVTGLLASVSAVAFMLALSPPAVVRVIWRRPEQGDLERAIGELMGATSEAEVVAKVLPPVGRIVGARAVALLDGDGALLGAHGASAEMLERLEDPHAPLLRLELSSGALLVWTSRYAPFFGGEEVRLLRTLGSLASLALDRSRLFAQERAARESLERADGLKSRFIALAAHELRAPVATVHGIVTTLDVRAHQLDPEQRAALESSLQSETTRLRLLVEQLLDLSRLEADAVPIAFERLRVRETIESVVRVAAAGRVSDIVVDVDPELEAMADPQALDHIVSNLVVNALRYGEPPIRISAEHRDRHFRLTVEDSGAGVPDDFVPQLFERFTRSPLSAGKASGTGLGLSIARLYAHAQEGDLLYEPGEPGGARFQLVLPRRTLAVDETE
jgi:signal transduction histidine kinase